MNIEIKPFLRKHGFTFKSQGDRGATWSNGAGEVFVKTSYKEIPGELRAMMDGVRELARKKKIRDMQEEQKLHTASQKAQSAAVLSVIGAAPESKPEPVREPGVTTITLRKQTHKPHKKMRGEERHYFNGRVKYLDALGETPKEIKEKLNAEGCRQPNGHKWSAGIIRARLKAWKAKPEVFKTIMPLAIGRKLIEKPAYEPVVAPAAPPVQPTPQQVQPPVVAVVPPTLIPKTAPSHPTPTIRAGSTLGLVKVLLNSELDDAQVRSLLKAWLL